MGLGTIPLGMFTILWGISALASNDTAFGLGLVLAGLAFFTLWIVSWRQRVMVDIDQVTIQFYCLTRRVKRSSIREWRLTRGRVGVMPRMMLCALTIDGKVVNLGRWGVWAPMKGRQSEALGSLLGILTEDATAWPPEPG